MRLWHRRSQDENFGIAAGQRYRAVGAPSILWEVTAIARSPWDEIPHARLHRVGAPRDAKTISLAVLRDARFFVSA
ncbi:MAG TPA: hypothetical protein VMU87_03740 [Stellaceae bacterium]|nr:hypothetical protein [Stellaceae bacterium]